MMRSGAAASATNRCAAAAGMPHSSQACSLPACSLPAGPATHAAMVPLLSARRSPPTSCWCAAPQVVQALHELNRLEVALNGPTLPADDGSGRKVGNHKVGSSEGSGCCAALAARACIPDGGACQRRACRAWLQRSGPPYPATRPAVPCWAQALAYAQAAGVVRTCAYRLRAPVKPGQLPWVSRMAGGARRCRAGSAGAPRHTGRSPACLSSTPACLRVAHPSARPQCAESICLDINQILETGSCDKLEAFRWVAGRGGGQGAGSVAGGVPPGDVCSLWPCGWHHLA